MRYIKKFFSYYRPHKKLFFFDLFCSVTIAVCNLFYPMIARNMMNNYVPNHNLKLLLIWAGVLACIYIIKAILTYCVNYYGHVLGTRIQGDMRTELFTHIESLPFTYFDENKTGSIMSRIINDLFEVSELCHHGPEDTLTSMLSIIGALIMLGLINPYLALMVLIYIPLMLLYTIKARKRLSSSFTESRKRTAEINAEIESSISGIRITKAYTAEEIEREKFGKVNNKLVSARSMVYKSMGFFSGGMGFFNDFLYLLALVGGGLMFFYEHITAADFTAFILYVTMLLSPLRTLTILFEQLQDGLTGFKRFVELMEKDPEYEPENPINGELDGDIVFDNVCFGYGKEDGTKGSDVLKNVSLTVKKGTTVALVGASGGGKTTICHLLPRFYLRDSGRISIGGIDINDVTSKELRSKIAVVSQDVFLFAGSIRDNILYGSPTATEEEMIEASKRANIHDYVQALPDGYDTEVGERGIKLSGGQKQRISIARAFLKNPPILILDEATSALDNMTEMLVQQALNELSQNRTTLVVAHRLSTVKNADEIIVVQDGIITERGSHEELVEQGGTYAELYKYQFRE